MLTKTSRYTVYSLLFLFTVLPLLAGFGFALSYSFGVTGVLNTGFTLSNWRKLFAEGNVFYSFIYSAGIAIVSLMFAVFVSMMLALKYASSFQKGVLNYLIYIPLAFPGIAAAFLFFQLFTKSGLLSRIFYRLHLINSMNDFPDLVNDAYSISMICCFFFLALPFFLLLFINIIKAERIREYEQLAATLSATKWQTRWKISVPIMLKKALPNIILYFIFIFGAFEIPLLLGRSHPETISVLAVRKLQRFNLLDLPQGYAVAVLYSLFVLVLLYFLFRSKKMADHA